MPRVLVYAYERVGRAMAGQAIRSVAIARALAADGLDVELGLRFAADEAPAGLATRFPVSARDLAAADVVVASVVPGRLLAAAILRGARFVFDLNAAEVFEQLEIHRDAPPLARRRAGVRARASLEARLLAADHVVATSERLRDTYVGALALLGRLDARHGDASAPDPLDAISSVAPFGFDEPPPRPGALRGKLDGIGAKDRVLLWGGGVWNWFDPLTAIRAAASIARARPDVKLVFMGTRSPTPGVPEMRMLADAHAEAARLGALGKSVFFREGWVAYDDRAAFYGDADLGLSLALPTLEARYAFRTRFMEYLAAGLPLVVSRGDELAAAVEREGLGAAVAPGDAAGLERAVLALLDDPARLATARERVLAFREPYRWPRALAPLVRGVRLALEGRALRTTRRDRARALGAIARGFIARAI